MPPWMSRDDTDDVPPPRSPLSTRAVRKPRRAASRAIPAPVIPPPMTSKSTGSAAIEASAAVRVRCEKGVSLVDRSPAWPPRGAMIRFERLTPGRCPRVNRRLCPPRAAGRGQPRENVMPGGNGRRVAIVAGCRTPFCKSGTTLKDVRAVDLARFVARELLERTNLDAAEVDAVIFGQVVPSALVPNVAREVSLLPQFPREIPAYSLNRACASSAQAVANASDEIALGDADVVLAGGVESLSDIPILASRRLADILVEASKAKTLGARLRTFSRIRPRDLVPVSPAIAEPSSGETMAKQNHIARDAQDRWALRSHELAARGTDDGRLTAEIAPWFPERPAEPVLTTDNGIRRDTSLEQMAKLRPVFDRQYGSVTAANSSPLTDGASAVLVMSDEAARALGYTPLAYVRSYAVAAVDPGWQLLQAGSTAATA